MDEVPPNVVSAMNKQGCLFCQEKDKQIAQLKNEILMLKQVEAPQWKGKDSVLIEKLSETEWRIVSHNRPDRTSNEIKDQVYVIPHQNVTVMWTIIKKNLTNGYCSLDDLNTPIVGTKWKTDFQEVIPALIKFYIKNFKLDLRVGKPNSLRVLGKYYFTHYRLPLLVLQHLNFIYYPKTIYRLKE